MSQGCNETFGPHLAGGILVICELECSVDGSSLSTSYGVRNASLPNGTFFGTSGSTSTAILSSEAQDFQKKIPKFSAESDELWMTAILNEIWLIRPLPAGPEDPKSAYTGRG